MEIATIGLDLAKAVIQLHAVDANDNVLWRKKLRRSAFLDTLAKVPACLIGMDACATAHYWAREITAMGHQVRLMPPAYVKAYLRRKKRCCQCRSDGRITGSFAGKCPREARRSEKRPECRARFLARR